MSVQHPNPLISFAQVSKVVCADIVKPDVLVDWLQEEHDVDSYEVFAELHLLPNIAQRPYISVSLLPIGIARFEDLTGGWDLLVGIGNNRFYVADVLHFVWIEVSSDRLPYVDADEEFDELTKAVEKAGFWHVVRINDLNAESVRGEDILLYAGQSVDIIAPRYVSTTSGIAHCVTKDKSPGTLKAKNMLITDTSVLFVLIDMLYGLLTNTELSINLEAFSQVGPAAMDMLF